MGREYAYVNATMRNRRAFVLAVHEVGAAFAMCVVLEPLYHHCRGSIAVVVARDYTYLGAMRCNPHPIYHPPPSACQDITFCARWRKERTVGTFSNTVCGPISSHQQELLACCPCGIWFSIRRPFFGLTGAPYTTLLLYQLGQVILSTAPRDSYRGRAGEEK